MSERVIDLQRIACLKLENLVHMLRAGIRAAEKQVPPALLGWPQFLQVHHDSILAPHHLCMQTLCSQPSFAGAMTPITCVTLDNRGSRGLDQVR